MGSKMLLVLAVSVALVLFATAMAIAVSVASADGWSPSQWHEVVKMKERCTSGDLRGGEDCSMINPYPLARDGDYMGVDRAIYDNWWKDNTDYQAMRRDVCDSRFRDKEERCERRFDNARSWYDYRKDEMDNMEKWVEEALEDYGNRLNLSGVVLSGLTPDEMHDILYNGAIITLVATGEMPEDNCIPAELVTYMLYLGMQSDPNYSSYSGEEMELLAEGMKRINICGGLEALSLFFRGHIFKNTFQRVVMWEVLPMGGTEWIGLTRFIGVN